MSERLCFRKRKRKHTDASLIKYKLLLSHCQDLSRLLIGVRATPWQKTFSLFPRGCFHPKAAIVRSCSRRQVAGPGWLVVPLLVHWSTRSPSLCSSSSPPTLHQKEMAALARPLLAVLLLLGAVLAAQVNVPYSTDLWVAVKLSVLDFCVRMFHYGPHLFYCYALNSGKSVIVWHPVNEPGKIPFLIKTTFQLFGFANVKAVYGPWKVVIIKSLA